MSGLVNPHTGMPMSTQRKHLTEPDLIKILESMRLKIDYLNQQNMQLGLYVEFLIENLLSMTDSQGEYIFQMDLVKFPEFAERRFKEIQEQINEARIQNEKDQAQQVIQHQWQGNEIDLNE